MDKDFKEMFLFSIERGLQTNEITVMFFKEKITTKTSRELQELVNLIDVLSQELKSHLHPYCEGYSSGE